MSKNNQSKKLAKFRQLRVKKDPTQKKMVYFFIEL